MQEETILNTSGYWRSQVDKRSIGNMSQTWKVKQSMKAVSVALPTLATPCLFHSHLQTPTQCVYLNECSMKEYLAELIEKHQTLQTLPDSTLFLLLTRSPAVFGHFSR